MTPICICLWREVLISAAVLGRVGGAAVGLGSAVLQYSLVISRKQVLGCEEARFAVLRSLRYRWVSALLLFITFSQNRTVYLQEHVLMHETIWSKWRSSCPVDNLTDLVFT